MTDDDQPQKPSHDMHGACNECAPQKPDPKNCTHSWHRLGGIDDCPVCTPDKPDATYGDAREWWLYQDTHTGTVHFSDKPIERVNLIHLNHVIEKSAYLELSASMCRVLMENDSLRRQNENAAQASITKAEVLRLANARNKELNEQCMAMANERLDQEWPVVKQLHAAEEREQKLVAAMSGCSDSNCGLVPRGKRTGMRTNGGCHCAENIRAALAEHKGGG